MARAPAPWRRARARCVRQPAARGCAARGALPWRTLLPLQRLIPTRASRRNSAPVPPMRRGLGGRAQPPLLACAHTLPLVGSLSGPTAASHAWVSGASAPQCSHTSSGRPRAGARGHGTPGTPRCLNTSLTPGPLSTANALLLAPQPGQAKTSKPKLRFNNPAQSNREARCFPCTCAAAAEASAVAGARGAAGLLGRAEQLGLVRIRTIRGFDPHLVPGGAHERAQRLHDRVVHEVLAGGRRDRLIVDADELGLRIVRARRHAARGIDPGQARCGCRGDGRLRRVGGGRVHGGVGGDGDGRRGALVLGRARATRAATEREQRGEQAGEPGHPTVVLRRAG